MIRSRTSAASIAGPFKTIKTKVPGMQLTELLPLQAKIADKFTLLRSMTHTGGGHPAGIAANAQRRSRSARQTKPLLPDWMTVANYLRSKNKRTSPLPNYVGVNPIINYDSFTIAGPGLSGRILCAILGERGSEPPRTLKCQTSACPDEAETRPAQRPRGAASEPRQDGACNFDREGELGALDQFESQAMSLLTNSQTRDAFDLSKEDAADPGSLRRNRWGQQLLLARRLVESGVEIITSSLHGPLCGRTQVWDDHAVDHHIFEALRFRMGNYDQAVSALIEDIYARGLDKRVLVVVTGEFGRTPKITL
jgi:hypothetical protein